jgi:lipoate-protein ligase A
MTSWQLILSSALSGQANMDIDLKLFHDFEKGSISSALRIYSWKPNCVSLGYSQKVEKEVDLDRAKTLGWDVVKRPTGGGIVFHNEAEVTYSLVTAIDNPLLPKGLVPSYKKISEAVVYGLNQLGLHAQIRNPKSEIRNKSEILNPKSQLCFSYPAEYEIVVEGPSTPSMELGTGSLGARKKIVGSAQKRGRKALLQQGSIFVRATPKTVYEVLKKDYKRENAVSVEEVLGRKIDYNELSEALIEGFKNELGISFNGK